VKCLNCSTELGDSCAAEHQTCETGEECFKDLTSEKLISSESLKFCHDDPIDLNLKIQGGISESDIWPWMYEIEFLIRGSTEKSFCAANQIGKDVLVTGKILILLNSATKKSPPYVYFCFFSFEYRNLHLNLFF